MATQAKPSFLARHWRLLAGTVVGVAAFAGVRAGGFPPGLSSLIGWNAGAVLYLVTTFWTLLTADEALLRRRAAAEDEGRSMALVIVLSAVVASLAATVLALHEAKGASHGAPSWAWVFSVLTLLQGWVIVQAVFCLHYAHRYFGDGDADGAPDGGIKFPGAKPASYNDFLYMAVCIGASAQVSDFSITKPRMRRLVTLHSLIAFFFNTTVLALGINILATVIGS